jgi:hypothetical protein
MRRGRRLLVGVVATICALVGVGVGGASAGANLQSPSLAPSPGRVPVPAPAPAPSPPAAGCQSASFTSVGFELPGDARVISEHDLPVCLTGTATVRFHGSRAAGCGPRGLCAYAGTDTWEPKRGTLTVIVVSVHGRRRTLQMFTPGGGSLAGVVTRRFGGRVAGTCRESSVPGFGPLPSLRAVHDGRIALRMPRGGVDVWPSVCAGPLAADLPPFPSIGLPVAQVLSGSAAATVDRSRPFSRGAFAGTVADHLKITTGLAEPGLGDQPPATHRRRYRTVTLTYQVQRPIGSVEVDWAHPTAGCRELDACGLHGRESLTLGAPASGLTLQIVAEAPASRPERDLLAALGLSHQGDPKGVGVVGVFQPRTDVSTTTSGQHGVPCRDRRSVGPMPIVILGSGGRLKATYSSAFEGDSLRTSCPGPALGLHALASATIAPGALASHRLTLSLTHPTAYDDHGYVVHLAPQLSLRLTRERLTQRVRKLALIGPDRAAAALLGNGA